MNFATLTLSLSSFLTLVLAPSTNQATSKEIQAANRVLFDLLDLSGWDNLPSCEDVHAAFNFKDATFKSTRCYVNTTSINEHSDAVSIAEPLYGSTCVEDSLATNHIDATTLCGYVPDPYSLPPARGNVCTCETWHIAQAAFAFCNCDPCAGIVDAELTQICQALYDECYLVQDQSRGFFRQTNPAAFFMLYGTGIPLGPSPQYSGC